MRKLYGTAVVLALAMAAPAPAAAPASAAAPAAAPTPGLYGGGAFGRYVQFVSVRLDPTGTTADQFATLTTSCAGLGAPLFDNIRLTNLRVVGGRFNGLAPFIEVVPAGIPKIGGLVRTGTVAAATQLDGEGRVRGTIVVRFSLLDPQSGATRGKCDTGPVSWVARTPSADAGSGKARPRRGASYRGLTSQDQPFVLRTARRGSRVDRVGITLLTSCPSALGRPLDLVATKLPIKRGRFAARRSFKREFSSAELGRVRESWSWRLDGRFGSRGVKGTWRVRATTRRVADGSLVGSCVAGTIRVRAVR